MKSFATTQEFIYLETKQMQFVATLKPYSNQTRSIKTKIQTASSNVNCLGRCKLEKRNYRIRRYLPSQKELLRGVKIQKETQVCPNNSTTETILRLRFNRLLR